MSEPRVLTHPKKSHPGISGRYPENIPRERNRLAVRWIRLADVARERMQAILESPTASNAEKISVAEMVLKRALPTLSAQQLDASATMTSTRLSIDAGFDVNDIFEKALALRRAEALVPPVPAPVIEAEPVREAEREC